MCMSGQQVHRSESGNVPDRKRLQGDSPQLQALDGLMRHTTGLNADISLSSPRRHTQFSHKCVANVCVAHRISQYNSKRDNTQFVE